MATEIRQSGLTAYLANAASVNITTAVTGYPGPRVLIASLAFSDGSIEVVVIEFSIDFLPYCKEGWRESLHPPWKDRVGAQQTALV